MYLYVCGGKTAEGILTRKRGLDILCNETLERIINLMSSLNRAIITIIKYNSYLISTAKKVYCILCNLRVCSLMGTNRPSTLSLQSLSNTDIVCYWKQYWKYSRCLWTEKQKKALREETLIMSACLWRHVGNLFRALYPKACFDAFFFFSLKWKVLDP